MTVDKFVHDKRREIGLSQAELADYAGVGLRFVRELEAGKNTLQMDKVNEVLRMFNAEISVQEMEVADEYI